MALEIRAGFLLNLLTVCDPPEDPKFIQHQLKTSAGCAQYSNGF